MSRKLGKEESLVEKQLKELLQGTDEETLTTILGQIRVLKSYSGPNNFVILPKSLFAQMTHILPSRVRLELQRFLEHSNQR